jgi:hypothetical protein
VSWRLEIRPEVETDLAAATLWYDMQQPGLGARFLDEVERGGLIKAWVSVH